METDKVRGHAPQLKVPECLWKFAWRADGAWTSDDFLNPQFRFLSFRLECILSPDNHQISRQMVSLVNLLSMRAVVWLPPFHTISQNSGITTSLVPSDTGYTLDQWFPTLETHDPWFWPQGWPIETITNKDTVYIITWKTQKLSQDFSQFSAYLILHGELVAPKFNKMVKTMPHCSRYSMKLDVKYGI